MDLTESFAPNSEQLTYAEIGDRVVTVTVSKVTPRSDKPKDPAVHLAEFPGKPLLPGVNVGNLLRKAWGLDGKAWVGRRMTLYGDPDVYFGKEKTGGVRVSHVSNIDRAVSVPKRGKGARGQVTVEPLVDSAPTAESKAESKAELNIAACESIPELREAWKYADPSGKKLIEARVTALETAAFDEEAGA